MPFGGTVLASVAGEQPRGPQFMRITQLLRLPARQRCQPCFRFQRDRRLPAKARAIVQRGTCDHAMDERKSVENQLDRLDSEIISSIDHSPPIRQHFAVEQGVILMISKAGLSETLMWRARAGQARRVASMLSPRDAALVEAYARECDDSARAASIEGARVDTRRSVEIQRRDDRSFRAPAKSPRPSQAA